MLQLRRAAVTMILAARFRGRFSATPAQQSTECGNARFNRATSLSLEFGAHSIVLVDVAHQDSEQAVATTIA